MKKYNVVLLGESHFCFKNGISKGILDCGCECINLSLGGTPSMQNLYELVRNKKILENADLIIFGSSSNDIARYNSIDLFPQSFQVINWLHKELYFLNKKTICFISPTSLYNKDCIKLVNNLHKKLAVKYGFNIIDINQIHLNSSYELIQRDDFHDFDFVMRELGKNIINNIDDFSYPLLKEIENDNPKFYFYPVCDMVNIDKNLFRKKSNSLCKEVVYDLENILKFKTDVIGLNIMGFQCWNDKDEKEIKIYDIDNERMFEKKITVECSYFLDIQNREFLITDKTRVCSIKNKNFSLVGFLLASPDGNYYKDKIEIEILANEIIEIPKRYNFDHLIPPIEWYKEIIDEYCSIMDPIKLQPLQNQISILNSTISSLEQNKIQLSQEKDKIQQDNIVLKQTLNSLPIKKQQLEISNLEQDLINKKLQTRQLSKKLGIRMNDFMPKITMINPASAKARIQNQLSYKLGQAMIVNSKSFLGYIRMPFVLSYIKDKHKQEQKIYQEKIKKDPSLALPPLESYPDYQEALKLKNHLSYKLGQALMQANKTWYGGGVYQIAI
ncbi:SGNH/GDSL hydrolase family protein [Campylobacter subantarcticus]|uniref:Putative lipase n=1 Tax=Campylobacter subantarcticus LMG 24374 TaxID=1388751 RepID=A0A0A8H929_9BACT|nr:SGNH/GDSL hydrolase family protein [Campylobacter subantarcticus]AJC90175.1 putative lipase [Campylobacter subantarcticus LMG 24374]